MDFMIKKTTVLNDNDWKNLHGNEVFVNMLRNKVICELKKDTSEDYDIFDYIKEVPEGLVYYNTENTYGHITIDVYFETALDKENFISFYNTSIGIDRIKK